MRGKDADGKQQEGKEKRNERKDESDGRRLRVSSRSESEAAAAEEEEDGRENSGRKTQSEVFSGGWR